MWLLLLDSASFIEIFEFWVSNLQPLSQHETKTLMGWGLWEHIPKVCSCARATPKKLWARRRAESYLQIASVGWHWGCRSGGTNGNTTGSVVKRCHEALVFRKHNALGLRALCISEPMFYQVRLVQYQIFVSLWFDGERRTQGFSNWKLS